MALKWTDQPLNTRKSLKHTVVVGRKLVEKYSIMMRVRQDISLFAWQDWQAEEGEICAIFTVGN